MKQLLVGAYRINLAFILVVADAVLTSILFMNWQDITEARVIFGVQVLFHAAFLWLSLLVVWNTFLIKNGLLRLLFRNVLVRKPLIMWLVRGALLGVSGSLRISYTSNTEYWNNKFLRVLVSFTYTTSVIMYASLLRLAVAAGKCSWQSEPIRGLQD